MCKIEKLTLTEKKIREINYLVISLVKPLFSRNFCQESVKVNFRNFYSVQCHRKNISSNQIFSFRVNALFSRNFYQKMHYFYVAQCGETRYCLSEFFSVKSTQVINLVNALFSRNFYQKQRDESEFHCHNFVTKIPSKQHFAKDFTLNRFDEKKLCDSDFFFSLTLISPDFFVLKNGHWTTIVRKNQFYLFKNTYFKDFLNSKEDSHKSNEGIVLKDAQIQGVSFEILQFQMAVAQKWCIFDPMLVKPKCV